jgi:hypothetical protein
MHTPQRILVPGGAGFIASHVAAGHDRHGGNHQRRSPGGAGSPTWKPPASGPPHS